MELGGRGWYKCKGVKSSLMTVSAVCRQEDPQRPYLQAVQCDGQRTVSGQGPGRA